MQFKDGVIRIRTDEPDYSSIPREMYDWSETHLTILPANKESQKMPFCADGIVESKITGKVWGRKHCTAYGK